MVKSCRKNKSKRVTCHQRYKIIKKVRDHHRKIKKEKRKTPQKFKKKDPGIPNSLPFKEELLKHIAETKDLEAKRRLNLLTNLSKTNKLEKKVHKKIIVDQSYAKHFFKVLNQADVIIEVLDARDPLGCRCLEAEKEIMVAKKKLILLLNKIDLVPPPVAQQWLAYFRNWYTTLPFKANTQKQVTNRAIIRGKIPNREDLNVQQGLGVDELVSLLGNMCRNHVGKLVVGFVGIPNTGKSAIINTLKRKNVAASSSVPGFTKECQLFKLSSKISLVDSPGVVLSKSEDACELALRNCTKPESLAEPELAVSAILQRCPKRQIMVTYSISDYESTTDFLYQLAQRMGRLKKGGVPDSKGAARIIVADWITGKLSHYTVPPESVAPIAEPNLPCNIAIDLTDFPLKELDDQTFAGLPQKLINDDFCPSAVIPPSNPFIQNLGIMPNATNAMDAIENVNDCVETEPMEV